MSLKSDLLKADKKGLFKCDSYYDCYSTGFLPIDYLNAFRVVYMDENGQPTSKLMTGLMGGKFITIVGYSGTGKTTLAVQMAWSICNSYPEDADEETKRKFKENSMFIHVDVEHTATLARIRELTGASKFDVDNRIVLNNENTYIEDVMGMLDQICQAKEANPDEYTYSIDGRPFGVNKPVKVYVPTVFLIDSLPAFTSKNTDVSTLEGDMSVNREVKQISQFYTKCLGRMHKYNVSIIAINHIKSKIQTNLYEPDKPQLMLIKNGESLPRGQAPIFYAAYLFRISASGAKANFKTEEDDGFIGFKSYLLVAKTKTAFIGGNVPLMFNGKIGYDPINTLLALAMEYAINSGNKNKMVLKGAEAYPFARKDFRSKFLEDEMFRIAILNAIQPILDSFVGTTASINPEENSNFIPINQLVSVGEDGIVRANNIIETNTAKPSIVLVNENQDPIKVAKLT